jgi:hypothetical protein
MIIDDDGDSKTQGNVDSSFGSASLAGYSVDAKLSDSNIELKVIGLHCPSCGSPIMDGEVVCSYCSTGLLYDLVSDGETVRFKFPPGAEELSRKQFFSESIGGLAKELFELVQNTERIVYVMVNKIPLLVTATTDPGKAVEQYKKLRMHIERAELGVFWTEALFKYKALVAKISAMNASQKKEIIALIERRHDSMFFYLDVVQKFIARPDLTVALKLAESLPADGEDEKLVAFVEKFSGYIEEISKSTNAAAEVEERTAPLEEALELRAPVAPRFNYLTGEKLADGAKVGTSLGGIAHFSSLSGEPFRSLGNHITRKAYRGLVSGEGVNQIVMYVTPDEAERIQSVDSQWTVYQGDVP